MLKLTDYGFKPLDSIIVDKANDIAESWERELNFYPDTTGFTKQHIRGIKARAAKLAKLRAELEQKMLKAINDFDEYQSKVLEAE